MAQQRYPLGNWEIEVPLWNIFGNRLTADRPTSCSVTRCDTNSSGKPVINDQKQLQ